MVMGDRKVGIGQLEVVDLTAFNEKLKNELLDAMRIIKKDKGNHTVALLLTDIMVESSQMLVVSDDEKVLSKHSMLNSKILKHGYLVL